MSDLDAAIRARLDGWLDDICGAWRNGCPVDGHAEPIKMRAALLAVLDLHTRQDSGVGYGSSEPGGYGSVLNVCRTCGMPHEYAVAYPCDELRAIAKELGVEVGG